MTILFPATIFGVHNYKMNNPSSTLEDLKKDYIFLNRFYQAIGIYLIVSGVLMSIQSFNPVAILSLLVGSIMVGLHFSYNKEVSDDYKILVERYKTINKTYMIVGIVLVVLVALTIIGGVWGLSYLQNKKQKQWKIY
jgi:hypothetical protein